MNGAHLMSRSPNARLARYRPQPLRPADFFFENGQIFLNPRDLWRNVSIPVPVGDRAENPSRPKTRRDDARQSDAPPRASLTRSRFLRRIHCRRHFCPCRSDRLRALQLRPRRRRPPRPIGGGSFGFATPWAPGGFNASFNTNYDIANGSLSSGPLLTSGNRATSGITTAIAGLTRSFATPIGTPGTTRYYSFLLRPEGTLNQGAFNGFLGLNLEAPDPAEPELFVGKPGDGRHQPDRDRRPRRRRAGIDGRPRRHQSGRLPPGGQGPVHRRQRHLHALRQPHPRRRRTPHRRRQERLQHPPHLRLHDLLERGLLHRRTPPRRNLRRRHPRPRTRVPRPAAADPADLTTPARR